MTPDTLLSRLEKAEGPSRELDCRIHTWVLWRGEKMFADWDGVWLTWSKEDKFAGRSDHIPHYTSSIDAAMGLIPTRTAHTKRRDYQINTQNDDVHAAVYRDSNWHHGVSRGEGAGARAVTIASLKAHRARSER